MPLTFGGGVSEALTELIERRRADELARQQLALQGRGLDLQGRGLDLQGRGQDIQRELGLGSLGARERSLDEMIRANQAQEALGGRRLDITESEGGADRALRESLANLDRMSREGIASQGEAGAMSRLRAQQGFETPLQEARVGHLRAQTEGLTQGDTGMSPGTAIGLLNLAPGNVGTAEGVFGIQREPEPRSFLNRATFGKLGEEGRGITPGGELSAKIALGDKSAEFELQRRMQELLPLVSQQVIAGVESPPEGMDPQSYILQLVEEAVLDGTYEALKERGDL